MKQTIHKLCLMVLVLGIISLGIGAKGCSWFVDVDEDIITGSSAPLPSAVSALNATAISSSQINLSWDDNSNNEDGVKIERKTGVEGIYSEIDSVGADITIYSDTGLVPNTTYYYRVRAYNENGDSMYSNEASATTQEEAEPPAPPDEVTSPNPVNGAINVGTGQQLGWATASGATSYDVYFGTDNPPLYQTNTSDLTYDPGTLSYDTTCYWQIDARNEAGTTTGNIWDFQTEAEAIVPPDQVTSPNPANGLTDIPITTSLSWGSASGATSYDVYFGTDNPPPYQTNTTALSYNPGPLTYTTTYYWQIDAKNAVDTTTGNIWNFQTGTFVPLTFQVDSLISPDDTDWYGDGDYGTYGYTAVDQSTLPDEIVTYYVKIENEGNTAESFTVTGTSAPGGWSVTYYYDGNNITAEMTGDGWDKNDDRPGPVSPGLNPFSGSCEIVILVSGNDTVTGSDTCPVSVWATNYTDASVYDEVVCTTTIKE